MDYKTGLFIFWLQEKHICNLSYSIHLIILSNWGYHGNMLFSPQDAATETIVSEQLR